jgi:hypothetical protein
MQDALRANISVESDDLLVVAFMPSVCGLCLTQGLESVNERLQSKHPNVLLHALVGEQGMRDREDVLRYRRTGLLDLPVTFIPAEELRTALFQHMGDRFPREPLYLRVDQDLRIRTAFQGNQVKPELLDRWLEANWPN